MSTFGKVYLTTSTIVAIILFALLIFLKNIPSEPLIAFLGVIVGSYISGVVQYATLDANMKQQLRLAVLDKRMQVHQEAFAMWQRLRFTKRPTKESTQLILDCQEWWNNNCLYLSSDARVAFKKAYIAADYLSQPTDIQAGPEARKKDVEDLIRAGEIIVKGVYLPSIGEYESMRVEKQSKKGAA